MKADSCLDLDWIENKRSHGKGVWEGSAGERWLQWDGEGCGEAAAETTLSIRLYACVHGGGVANTELAEQRGKPLKVRSFSLWTNTREY